MRALGRNLPRDFAHVVSHPLLESLPLLRGKPTPVVGGTEWLTDFDSPVQSVDGRFRVTTVSGSSRGGHCYCLEQAGEPDLEVAHIFYDQGEAPACEGFGNSRALTLLTGVLYDAFWLYDDSRRAEGAYPDGEGSTNKAAGDALRKWGDHYAIADGSGAGSVIQRVPWSSGKPGKGIKSFHFATSVEEIRAALGFSAAVAEFPILNSWGKDGYPHRVYLPDTTVDWLLARGAEYTILVP